MEGDSKETESALSRWVAYGSGSAEEAVEQASTEELVLATMLLPVRLVETGFPHLRDQFSRDRVLATIPLVAKELGARVDGMAGNRGIDAHFRERRREREQATPVPEVSEDGLTPGTHVVTKLTRIGSAAFVGSVFRRDGATGIAEERIEDVSPEAWRVKHLDGTTASYLRDELTPAGEIR